MNPVIRASLESLAVELDAALSGGELSERLRGLVYPKEFTPKIEEGGIFRLTEHRADRLMLAVPTRTGQSNFDEDADMMQPDPNWMIKREMQYMALRSKGLEWRAWWPTYSIIEPVEL